MKFLCISCNEQMKLQNTDSAVAPDKAGSLSIRYECPECLVEIAMLTNSFETQLVTSLGVEIGGKTVDGKAAAGDATQSAGKCPFSEKAREAMTQGLSVKPGEVEGYGAIRWTAQASVRLEKMPEFARPMARNGIEQYAVKKGYTTIDEKCLDEAKIEFGM